MATQKPTIFISYRRADHRDFVALVHREFVQHYDEDHVFMDLYNIPPFTDFTEYIHEKVGECDAMVVIIGPEWVSLLKERMQSGEDDFVRLEVASAIQLGKLIAPICIKGAKMPRREDLPDDFKPLARLQAAELKDFGRHFSKEVEIIIVALEAELERRNNKKGTPPKIETPPPPVKTKPKLTPEQQKLLDLIADSKTNPPARAKAGRQLAVIGDPRPGVGLRSDGIPDIDWVEIPAGEFVFGGDKKAFNGLPYQKLHLDAFYTGRYPVTYIQYQAFVNARDGYRNDSWWVEFAQLRRGLYKQRRCIPNHPCENVTWYDAVAFCQWLSARLEIKMGLPTEQQWEKAARGINGWIYPWGNDYISRYANIDEKGSGVGPYYRKGTTAVGIYPQGMSPYKILDMSGNVWEWCLNEFRSPANIELAADARRVIRGGAWLFGDRVARSTSRFRGFANGGSDVIGFRVVCHQPF